MKNNAIYLLFACDEWKTYASMRLVMATTSTMKLDETIEEQIKDGSITFDGDEGESAADAFMDTGMGGQDLREYHRLGFAFVQIVKDGELT